MTLSQFWRASVESRKVPRYPVQAPVTFMWSEEGQPKSGEGWTRDISEIGVFVYSTRCPPQGAQTEIEVVLPPLGQDGRILRIHMVAAVIRVSGEPMKRECSGFALKSCNVILKTDEGFRREIELSSDDARQQLLDEFIRAQGIKQGNDAGFGGKKEGKEGEEER